LSPSDPRKKEKENLLGNGILSKGKGEGRAWLPYDLGLVTGREEKSAPPPNKKRRC